MANTAKEPNDPSKELIDYEPAVGGTTNETDGRESTVNWPDSIDSDELSSKERVALQDWLQSSCTELSWHNYRKVSSGHNKYSVNVVRRVANRAFPEQRGLKDISDKSREAVAILAHEGSNSNPRELAEKYIHSDTHYNFVMRAYPDLINKLQSEMDAEKIKSVARDLQKDSQQKTREKNKSNGANFEAEKRGVYEYLESGGEYEDASDLKERLDLDSDLSHIGGWIGSFASMNADTDSDSNTPGEIDSEQESSNDDIQISITLHKEQVSDLLMGGEPDFDIKSLVVAELLDRL